MSELTDHAQHNPNELSGQYNLKKLSEYLFTSELLSGFLHIREMSGEFNSFQDQGIM